MRRTACRTRRLDIQIVSISVRKIGASRQIHEAGDKTSSHARAVIDEHGYTVRITVDINYNRLSARQIPGAHNNIRAIVESALMTAESLRGNNPGLFDVEPPTEMDPNHA